MHASIDELEAKIKIMKAELAATIRQVQLSCDHPKVLYTCNYRDYRDCKVCETCGLAEEANYRTWQVLTTEYVKTVSHDNLREAMRGLFITYNQSRQLETGKATLSDLVNGVASNA